MGARKDILQAAKWSLIVMVLAVVIGSSWSAYGTVAAAPAEQPADAAGQAMADAKNKAEKDGAKDTFRDQVKGKLGERFAGVTQDGNTVVVHVKGNLSDNDQKALAPLAKQLAGAAVAYRAVQYSRAELDKGVANITQDLLQLVEEHKVYSVGIDESTNELVVGVDAATMGQARSALAARYRNVPMRFEVKSPVQKMSRSNSPGIYKAGLSLDVPIGGTVTPICTTAFNVRDANNFRRALTAGHCLLPGDAIYHGGVHVGFTTQKQFDGDMDAAAYSVIPTSSPWLYRSNDWLVPIYGARIAYKGEGACFSGLTSGMRCGVVTLTNVSYPIWNGSQWIKQTGMDAFNAVSQAGDSGAPVFFNTSGIGILSAGDNTNTYYTPLPRILQRWGMRMIGNDPKTISPRHSNKCLDVDLGNWGNGSQIQQWQCWKSDNQAFYVEPQYLGDGLWSDVWYQFKAKFSGRCIDFHMGQSYNGGKIQQWDCWGGSGQNFKFTTNGAPSPHYMLASRFNGRCIDVIPNNSNGTVAHQWDCWNGPNQTFRLYEYEGF